jgi:outer membrane usher protein
MILHHFPRHRPDMWLRRATLVIAIVFLFLWPVRVFAQSLIMVWTPDESESSAAGKRVSLALFVNGVDKGVIIAVLRKPEILVLVDDLKSAGLEAVDGEHVIMDGKYYVPLSSLAPKITYTFDEKEIALRITADPTLLGTTTINVGGTNTPPGMTYLKSPGVFFNYAFNAMDVNSHSLLTDFNNNSLFTEGGISIDGNLLYSSLSLNTQNQFVRGLTNLTIDNPSQLTRLMVGDTEANTGLLGGAVYLGGIGFSRNFALNPYFISSPMQQLSGQVTMPSMADIYVNGMLVKTMNLQPGQFNLQNLPVAAGAGNTQVIIRNAFGQQQQINAPYYLSTLVLKEGLSQYTYDLGFIRNNMGVESWDYGPLAFAASHLYGFTDWLTAGAFFQADDKVITGGPQLAFRTPLGQLGLWGALSGGDQAGGGSAAATYSYITPKYSFGGDITLTSKSYSTLSLPPEQDRALVQADAFFSFQIGRLGVSPTFRYSDFRDAGRTYSASIVNNYRLSNSINLQLTVTRSCPEGSGPLNTEIFMALNYFFGKNTVGTVSYDHQSSGQSGDGSDLGTVQLQKSLPIGTGYGYLVQAQLGEQAQEIANIQYQGPYGLYEFDYNRSMGQDSTSLAISGGLVGIDGHVFATRAVQDSYALIKVPGVKDVTGYNSNQSVGKTDANGNLLVPDLLSYYGNDLSINDHDIPMDYSVESTNSIVATPYRGGGVVTFPVHRLQAFTGRLEIENAGKIEKKSDSEEKQTIAAAPAVPNKDLAPVGSKQIVIPVYGELTVTLKETESTKSKEFRSPVGQHGEFYLENIPAGNWPAVIDYQDGQCKFIFAIPSSQERFVKMETVKCILP